MAIQSVDPTSGNVIASYDQMTPEVVNTIVDQVHQAFLGWRETPFIVRAALMRKAARVLRDNAGEYARLMLGKWASPCAMASPRQKNARSAATFMPRTRRVFWYASRL
jgi:succinate-semialdehyde dehydrogenase/glutarate-semialdehyde dehydrogenase